jgi:hypothetical protein
VPAGHEGEAGDRGLRRIGVCEEPGACRGPACPAYTTRLGTDSEDLLLQEWIADLEKTVHAALEQVDELAEALPNVETVVGHGHDWEEALHNFKWRDGEVLVIGSRTRDRWPGVPWISSRQRLSGARRRT